MDTQTFDTRTLVRVALVAALIGALGFVPPLYLPIAAGVPITAQTLGVMLAGLLLGARAGAAATALFAFVVLMGVPLLSGGRGGIGILATPTAGFFLGFIPGAFVTGLLAERLRLAPFLGAFLAAIAGGIGVVYLCGVPVSAMVARLPLGTVALASAVFLPGDLLKAFGAALLATTVLRSWSVAQPRRP